MHTTQYESPLTISTEQPPQIYTPTYCSCDDLKKSHHNLFIKELPTIKNSINFKGVDVWTKFNFLL